MTTHTFKPGDKVRFKQRSPASECNVYTVDHVNDTAGAFLRDHEHRSYPTSGLELVSRLPSERSERSLISMDKKYTRNGKPVTILTIDRETNYGNNSVVVMMSDGSILYRDKYGLGGGDSLVEAKERINLPTKYVVVYKNGGVYLVDHKPGKNSKAFACIKVDIDVEHGGGL